MMPSQRGTAGRPYGYRFGPALRLRLEGGFLQATVAFGLSRRPRDEFGAYLVT